MSRIDRAAQRRERALSNLQDQCRRLRELIATTKEDLRAFERNEKSLDQPPVVLHRYIEEWERDLDRCTVEINNIERRQGIGHA